MVNIGRPRSNRVIAFDGSVGGHGVKQATGDSAPRARQIVVQPELGVPRWVHHVHRLANGHAGLA